MNFPTRVFLPMMVIISKRYLHKLMQLETHDQLPNFWVISRTHDWEGLTISLHIYFFFFFFLRKTSVYLRSECLCFNNNNVVMIHKKNMIRSSGQSKRKPTPNILIWKPLLCFFLFFHFLNLYICFISYYI